MLTIYSCVCTVYYIFLNCRLLIWFKQSLMFRREMNIFSGWWSSQIRSFVCLRSLAICWISFMLCTLVFNFLSFWKPSIIVNACDFRLFFLQKWMEIIGQAHQNVDFLKDQDVIRTVLNILQVWFCNLWYNCVNLLDVHYFALDSMQFEFWNFI